MGEQTSRVPKDGVPPLPPDYKPREDFKVSLTFEAGTVTQDELWSLILDAVFAAGYGDGWSGGSVMRDGG